MVNGIILTVNLQGKLGSQKRVIELVETRKGDAIITKKIDRIVREPLPCVRKTNISGEVVSAWISGRAPFFVKEFIWKNMSKKQRLAAYIQRFDEGLGVNFQEL